jgi:endoglucanase
LNIPESGNGIPDILDEATWGVDYYRRLQRPDWSVSVGLFMNTYPRLGWVSWQDPMELTFIRKTPTHHALRAGRFDAGAQPANRGSPAKSKLFLDSALRAWDWAITREPEKPATLAASAGYFA